MITVYHCSGVMKKLGDYYSNFTDKLAEEYTIRAEHSMVGRHNSMPLQTV